MKHSSIFFLIIGLLVFAGGLVYLARRTAFCLGIRPTWLYVGYAIVFLASFKLMWQARMPFAAKPAGHWLCVAATVVVGLLLCLLVAFLLTDIVQLFAHFRPYVFGTIVLTLTFLLFAGGTWNAARPRLKTMALTIDKLHTPVRVVQLTDIHLGQFRGRKHLERLVDMTNSAKPDIVVITGDLFDAYYNFSEATLEPLKRVKAPVYFVEGNHDIYVDSPRIKEMLRHTGVRVLENEVVTEHGIQIVGLDYLAADEHTEDQMHVPERPETIRSVLANMQLDSTLATIGLHHNPVGAEYFAAAGTDLYLAGHTHGGQFYPLVWINDWEFAYNRGLYRCGKMYVYVSCGSGTTGPVLRIGTRPEVTLFVLNGQ